MAAEKVLIVIRSEARDLLFFAIPKKQQIPRANTAVRNDKLWVFLQLNKYYVGVPAKNAQQAQILVFDVQ